MSQATTTTSSQPSTARRSWLKRLAAALGGAALARPAAASPTQTQSYEPYVGEIILVPFGYAPRGFALCNGQILNISQYPALFALLGVTYGGNGRTTFALPNLQGYTPIGMGQGAGLTNYPIGSVVDTTTATPTTDNLPAHSHLVPASSAAGTSSSPAGAVPAVPSGTNANGEPVEVLAYTSTLPGTTEAASAISTVGSSQAINPAPYLVLNYCIATQGIFPQRY